MQNEWNKIKEILSTLSSTTDAEGFLVPRKDTRLFIDWVRQEKWTALQVLWWWAQNSAASLAGRLGDTETAGYWTKSARKFQEALVKAAWSENEQRWLSINDPASEITRHPNFFAVVSGLAGQSQYAGIRALLQGNKAKPVGSPYMAGLMAGAGKKTLSTPYFDNVLIKGVNAPVPKPSSAAPGQLPIYINMVK